MWWFTIGCAPQLPAVAEAQACEEVGPDGGELFARTWVPLDPRAPGGDGLGPTYNADSCAACHSQGGVGGAGAMHANVVLMSAGKRTEVLHKFGPRPLSDLDDAASTSFAREFGFVVSARNTPALFGAGAIDRVPDAVLLVAEALGVPDHPEISGRIGRDLDGRPTRFGWKGQTATLAAFVENACANELGLETPTVGQPGAHGPGLDVDDPMLDALVRFTGALPQPIELPTPGADRGRQVFADIGCAACHSPTVGDVVGVYSDLLLHDLGDGLADQASSYGAQPERVAKRVALADATASEWRTAPLWGLRDSAPYLHDGRADTIALAIDGHGGEATAVVEVWRRLPTADEQALMAFLRSLTAPPGA